MKDKFNSKGEKITNHFAPGEEEALKASQSDLGKRYQETMAFLETKKAHPSESWKATANRLDEKTRDQVIKDVEAYQKSRESINRTKDRRPER